MISLLLNPLVGLLGTASMMGLSNLLMSVGIYNEFLMSNALEFIIYRIVFSSPMGILTMISFFASVKIWCGIINYITS